MAPLRFLLILVLILAFVLIGLPLDALARSFSWRLREQLPLIFHHALINILQIRIRMQGTLVSGPALIIPNHVSWTDISVIGSLKPMCFVAKKEVAGWPIFGVLAKAQGSVFVDRARRMQVHKVNLEMADHLSNGRAVVLFPEGTTGDGHRLLHFHTSHLAAAREALRQNSALKEVAVQPVSILYLRRHGMVMERNARAAVAWYGDSTLLPHLWDLLKMGPIDVVLNFGEPLPYVRDTDRKIFARRLAAIVRQTNYAALYGRGGEILAQENHVVVATREALPLLNEEKTP